MKANNIFVIGFVMVDWSKNKVHQMHHDEIVGAPETITR